MVMFVVSNCWRVLCAAATIRVIMDSVNGCMDAIDYCLDDEAVLTVHRSKVCRFLLCAGILALDVCYFQEIQ